MNRFYIEVNFPFSVRETTEQCGFSTAAEGGAFSPSAKFPVLIRDSCKDLL